MKRKFGRCPHCARPIEITPTGSIKGIVALAGLAGLRVHPLIVIALGIAGLIWGDEVETWIRARVRVFPIFRASGYLSIRPAQCNPAPL